MNLGLINLLRITITTIALALTSQAYAFSFLISESQINSALSLTFPYATNIGGNQITLSEPSPKFFAQSQEIGITINIAVKEGGKAQSSAAKATLRGGIKFDNKAQQLQLVKPKLEKLDWQGTKGQAIPQIEQLIGQDLPIIVLLDVKQLTGGAFTPTLSDIKVRAKGIEILF